jgi:hypothetical protein
LLGHAYQRASLVFFIEIRPVSDHSSKGKRNYKYCQNHNYKNFQTYCTQGKVYPICCCRVPDEGTTPPPIVPPPPPPPPPP